MTNSKCYSLQACAQLNLSEYCLPGSMAESRHHKVFLPVLPYSLSSVSLVTDSICKYMFKQCYFVYPSSKWETYQSSSLWLVLFCSPHQKCMAISFSSPSASCAFKGTQWHVYPSLTPMLKNTHTHTHQRQTRRLIPRRYGANSLTAMRD